MAKLYFLYAAMNAGKTTALLQVAHNYKERGMTPYLMTARFDTRVASGIIASRIGLQSAADVFYSGLNLYQHFEKIIQNKQVDCVLIDEAQFLETQQVDEIAAIVDDKNIPVMCYGLRTDFQAQFFTGSARLLALADEIREIRTICFCGKKATMVLKINAQGQVVSDGEQIEIGGNDRYISVCRAHWFQKKPYSTSTTAICPQQRVFPLEL